MASPRLARTAIQIQKRRKRRKIRRLSVEILEDRRLLAAMTAGGEAEDCPECTLDVVGPQVALVDVPVKPVTSLGVTFDEPVNAGSLIEDGSIVSAVSLTRLADGPVALTAERFYYDAGTRTLEISFDEPLPDGTYQLRLDDDLLADLAGNHLQGGEGGNVLEVPVLGVETVLTADGLDIQAAGYSVPSLSDWNGDGVDDLIVGEKTLADEGKVRIYLNQGTAIAPVYGESFYAQSLAADLAVPASGCLGVFPRVFDWTQDGRKDLVLGLADGTVQVALNENTDTDPVFGTPIAVQVGPVGAKVDVDVGNRATLDIVDWNNDGRFDVVLGDFDGRVHVLINAADTGLPDFVSETVVTAGSGDLLVPGGRSSVAVGDLDGDGQKDLVAGNTDGQLVFYRNIGSDSEPEFGEHGLIRSGGDVIDLAGVPRSRPFLGDANGDGALDILVGASDGLVRQYNGSPPAEAESASGIGGAASDGDYVFTFQVDPSAQDSAWQSPQDPLDVNNDGFVTALDALILINRIHIDGPGPLPATGDPGTPPLYVDCSGNGEITPLDILLVFREINAHGPRIAGQSTDGGSCELNPSGPPSCEAEGEADQSGPGKEGNILRPIHPSCGPHRPDESR